MIKSETQKLRELAQRASEAGDVMQMLAAADELLRREPDDVDALFIAGTAFYRGGQEGMAVTLLNAARCATKDPHKLGAIWCNIGCALQEYQPAEAYRAFMKSLEFGTPPPGTYDNICAVASKIGRHAEALEWADKSRAVDTSHNKSFALMHLGRWAEAWKLYAKSAGTETRPKTERDYGLPRWDGKSPGKVIIHGEQGIGDEIMFLSMLPRDFAGVIETSPRIAGLVERGFPLAKVYGTLLQAHLAWPFDEKADWHLEMGGIGEYFQTEPFAGGGFLAADEARGAAWAEWLRCAASGRGGAVRSSGAQSHGADSESGLLQLGRRDGRLEQDGRLHLLVGLAWTGGTWATGRANRTIPFELIAELIEAHPDVTFVNLEYEDRAEELRSLKTANVLNPYWATKKGADLDDLAALVSGLDLVISTTTSLVDLAGALGVPTWAMVDAHPQWRYSEAAGADKMWFYDCVRVFRQTVADNGRWGRVVDLVNRALKTQTMVEDGKKRREWLPEPDGRQLQ